MSDTWKVRHEGSPQAAEGVTLEQIEEGLLDGVWEPTDEVMGPGESTWVPIAAHPRLEEAALEVEPPPPRQHHDETSVDMNALIDVTLVLLIFFIILASYTIIHKRLEAPELTADAAGPPIVTQEQVARSMVHVTLQMENGVAVARAEGKELDRGQLTAELKRLVTPGKTILLLEHGADVPHGEVVRIQDAAKGAGMTQVCLVVPRSELPGSQPGR